MFLEILLTLLPLTNGILFYNNTLLHNSSGIFYNHLGISQISTTKLTLLSYINITQLQKSRDIAMNYFSKSSRLCNLALEGSSKQNHVSFHCELTLKIISDQLKQINEKDEVLSHISGKIPETRRKRGLINGVSYALHWLFGTPDADDAKYYSNSINSLFNNNKQTQTLLKSQIQIISSTIRNFNESVISLKQNENRMNENFASINKLSANINSYVDELSLKTLVTQQITTLSSLTNKLANEYEIT